MDGAYDFKNGNWKSGDEIIQDSEWVQSEYFTYGYVTYPILLDRIAFVKVLDGHRSIKMGPLGWNKLS